MSDRPYGLLFIGGEGPSGAGVEEAINDAGFVVAADSGYDLARSLGVMPDLLVGDMDSIAHLSEAEGRLDGKIERYDPLKDETDTEIGLRTLHERGFTEVTIIGGGGGRLDHLLGIVGLFDRVLRPKRWLTASEEVVHIEGFESFSGMKDVVCSFFPVGPEPARMTSSGLKWPLDGLEWRHGDSGVSNVGVSDRVTVTMLQGRLIMVRNMGESTNV